MVELAAILRFTRFDDILLSVSLSISLIFILINVNFYLFAAGEKITVNFTEKERLA